LHLECVNRAPVARRELFGVFPVRRPAFSSHLDYAPYGASLGMTEMWFGVSLGIAEEKTALQRVYVGVRFGV
jgi:hypothetical protein